MDMVKSVSYYSKLLQNIMLKVMVDGLYDNWNFRQNLESAIHEILNSIANSNSY